MREPIIILIPLITILLLSAKTSTAFALPPLPSSFYGTVKINGFNVPIDTNVSAYIDDFQFASTIVLLYNGETFYSLDVPGDDPATPEVEGGLPGSPVVFYIGDQEADQAAVWQSGTNSELNLTTQSQYTLSVYKTGNGSGTITSDPEGIDCGITCSLDFDYNTVVTVTATPDSGFTFIGWSNACVGTGTCQVTMNADKSVTAIFDELIFTFLPIVFK